MSEYAVVIRRGPDCIQPDSAHMLPSTIRPTLEDAQQVRDWYQRALVCDLPQYAKDCRYVVVELTEVES